MLTLTQKEIQQLTGYTWKRKQIEELTRRGIDFEINGRGALIVLRSEVQSGKQEEEPNLEAL